MPLSEYEQRVLEQMERALKSDDPRLANTLQSPPRRSALRYVAAGAAVLMGLLLLVLGVALSQTWLGVVGFILMFGGVAYAFQAPRSQPRGVRAGVAKEKGSPGPRDAATGAVRTDRAGFLGRLEERWDRRREHGR